MVVVVTAIEKGKSSLVRELGEDAELVTNAHSVESGKISDFELSVVFFSG